MGKQSMDALLVSFITNFDIDMMDATVAYCIVLYCNHRNERIASCGSHEQRVIRHSYHRQRLLPALVETTGQGAYFSVEKILLASF